MWEIGVEKEGDLGGGGIFDAREIIHMIILHM